MSVKSQGLEPLRQQIDELDAQLLALLNRRAEVVRQVGVLKARIGQAAYVPSREREIYERLRGQNPGPLPFEAVRAIFREVLSACRALEGPLRVAFLGPQATFTQLACLQHFGSGAELVPRRNIADVFAEVERERAQFGVVPIENSNEGIVSHTLDTFVDSPLQICAEVLLEISLDLLSQSGRLDAVREVHSHPQALAQCRGWLEEHLPGVPTHDAASTAAAAQLAAREPQCAAIASEVAAALYALQVVAKRIQDQAQNYTRFLVIGRESAAPTGADKTSVMFAVKDEPGLLHRCLEPFAHRGINLSKIESRPLKGRPWEYMFFVDLDGHGSDPNVGQALAELEAHCLVVKSLGSYPRAL